jgi:hypothetical protein
MIHDCNWVESSLFSDGVWLHSFFFSMHWPFPFFGEDDENIGIGALDKNIPMDEKTIRSKKVDYILPVAVENVLFNSRQIFLENNFC